ncbi:Quinidine resistance protein-like protein [Hapsidospora chrysogenum ATCC 11550]|uniref:Quinidine resistance protein-like protein n=1 Tax=Hapsidospora chrysogenum (strain ATCC 11550 / CBS 779.69 / DSM 880 / IAM 14645 / JCM 23072 / IMI 49137) TaxID=857340 RepID=A0A086T087_HAPC1|nr:Quinidine resistance protein-like protein [Hapsidospora chrysogenum ATCC 11550]
MPEGLEEEVPDSNRREMSAGRRSVDPETSDCAGDQFPEQPYTSFTKSQLRGLRLLLGFSAITSPLTATIYFPLLPLLRTQFHVSAQAINLTLTIYIIFQAVSPVLFGPLSDTYGRRPVLLFTLAIYLISNIGLAANEHNYAALPGCPGTAEPGS